MDLGYLYTKKPVLRVVTLEAVVYLSEQAFSIFELVSLFTYIILSYKYTYIPTQGVMVEHSHKNFPKEIRISLLITRG